MAHTISSSYPKSITKGASYNIPGTGFGTDIGAVSLELRRSGYPNIPLTITALTDTQITFATVRTTPGLIDSQSYWYAVTKDGSTVETPHSTLDRSTWVSITTPSGKTLVRAYAGSSGAGTLGGFITGGAPAKSQFLLSGTTTTPGGKRVTIINDGTYVIDAAGGIISNESLSWYYIDGSDGTVSSEATLTFNSGTPTNQSPVITPVPNQTVNVGQALNINLANYARDPEGVVLTFAKVSGNAGINIAANGALTGSIATAGSYDIVWSADDNNSTTQDQFTITVTEVSTGETYTFEDGTVGTAPAGITAISGALEIANTGATGLSGQYIHSTKATTTAPDDVFRLDHFAPTSADQTLTWRRGQSSSTARDCMLLRPQSGDSSLPGIKQGYGFQTSASNGSLRIYRFTSDSADLLTTFNFSGWETHTWYRASVVGNRLKFEYSSNGATWTSPSTLNITDSVFTGSTGNLYYINGFGATPNTAYIDDIQLQEGTVAPIMPADTSVNVAENSTVVGTFPVNTGNSVTYSLTGTDASFFNINATTGAVTFKTAPNFEAPADSGANNTYVFNVVATNSGGTDSQVVTVTVTDVAETSIPVMPADTSVNVNENTTVVGTFTASSGTGVTYTLSGTDAALFNIGASTGQVSFKTTPNYEDPADADSNNTYLITVTGTNGDGSDSQNITITVLNVADAAPEMPGDAVVNVPENTLTVGTFAATSGTSIVYSLMGTDASFFEIDPTSGAVEFLVAPNFESPNDMGNNNSYNIIVVASNSDGTAEQSVTINVTDVAEVPGPVMPANTTVTVIENEITVGTFTITSASTDVTYSLNGPDAIFFNIDIETGVVTFKSPVAYEE